MTIEPIRTDVAILGGGFSGLAAALDLTDNGYRVVVLERLPQLGGLASSHALDGYDLEKYYHHYFKTDEEVVRLTERLGLSDRLVWSDVKQALYADGELHSLSTPLDLLSFRGLPLSQRLKLGLLARGLRGPSERLDGISTEAWIRRWVGNEAYERYFQPLVWAKFGRDGSEISAAFARGRMLARTASRGRFGWTEQLGYLDGGSAVLVAGLKRELEASGAAIRTGATVRALKTQSTGFRVVAELDDEELLVCEADQVINTLPAPVLQQIAVDLPGEAMETLASISYRGVVVATLALRRSLSPNYWISVVDSGVPFTALIEHTRLHPPDKYGGTHVLYVGSYVEPQDNLWHMTDAEVIETFTGGLLEVWPRLTRSDLIGWRVARDRYATPVFRTGYGETLDRLSSAFVNLHLAGTLKVYPDSRNVNSAIRIGQETAAAVRSIIPPAPRGRSR